MPTINKFTIQGSTSAADIDETTRLFRRLADRDKSGDVSVTEAEIYVDGAENSMGPNIRTTQDCTLDIHEQIGALDHEARKLPVGSAQRKTLTDAAAQLMQDNVSYHTASIENNLNIWQENTDGTPVAQYGNIVFVAANTDDHTPADAKTWVQEFFTEASGTNVGRYLLELMVKQDNGKPCVINLSPKTGEHVDSECSSHNDITLYYNDHSISDPHTMMLHELSHAVGFYYQGDIDIIQDFVNLYDVDTNQNGINDADELQKTVTANRLDKYNPLQTLRYRDNPHVTFGNFDRWGKQGSGFISHSYSEHVATFFEKAYQLELGREPTRKIYDIYEIRDMQREQDLNPFNPHKPQGVPDHIPYDPQGF